MVTACRNLLDGFASDALTLISGRVVSPTEPTKLHVSEVIDGPRSHVVTQ